MGSSKKKSKTSHAAGSTSKTEGQTSGADTPTTGDKNSSALVAAEATETDAPTSCAQPADGKPSTLDDIMSLSSAVPSPVDVDLADDTERVPDTRDQDLDIPMPSRPEGLAKLVADAAKKKPLIPSSQWKSKGCKKPAAADDVKKRPASAMEPGAEEGAEKAATVAKFRAHGIRFQRPAGF